MFNHQLKIGRSPSVPSFQYFVRVHDFFLRAFYWLTFSSFKVTASICGLTWWSLSPARSSLSHSYIQLPAEWHHLNIYIYLKLSVFLMNLISTSTLHSSFSLYFRWHDHFTSEAGSPPGFLNIFLAIFSFRFPPPPTFHLYPHWICSPPFIWNMAFYFFCM